MLHLPALLLALATTHCPTGEDEIVVIRSQEPTVSWIGKIKSFNPQTDSYYINVTQNGDEIFIDSFEVMELADYKYGWSVYYDTEHQRSSLNDLTCGRWTQDNEHFVVINCNVQGTN